MSLRNFDDGIGFAHTSDNLGPQSVPQVAEFYRALDHEAPGVPIRAATLDDYGKIVWARRADLPVVELELGDSWIYGSASDPHKTRRLLALQRLYGEFAAEGLSPRRYAFGRALALVPEHTCGVDIKSYLRDETAWDRAAFEALRPKDYRFHYTEASWAEQHAYFDAAIAELDPADRTRADTAGTALEAAPVDARGGWQIDLDPASGDVRRITSPAGRTIAGAGDSLLGFRYESYDASDIDVWMDTYLTERPIPDLTSGLRAARREHLLEFLYLLPNGFSTPTTTTLAFIKAGYNVAFEPTDARQRVGTSKIRLARDGTKFFLIILKIVTIYSPMRIFLPLSLVTFVVGVLYAIWNVAAHARIPNGSVLLILFALGVFLVGLVSEQISAMRFEGRE